MRRAIATRYVTPLREGGSLPAIFEADDAGLYVVKFRSAGQGRKALVAEVISGELARAAGLRVPELVAIEVDPALGRNEPDGEIRDLLKASAGLNLGLDYLPGSITFDPVAGPAPSADDASAVVWLDAFVTNVDRTPRNPNLLTWHRQLWLIDHGASLYFQHAWDGREDKSRMAFPLIKDHVLLPWAKRLRAAHERLVPLLSEGAIARAVGKVPDEFLAGDDRFASPDAARAAYAAHLERRLAAATLFLEEAERARA
jgi:hypothetical protein